MEHIDLNRVVIFTKTHLNKKLGDKLLNDLNTLDNRSMTLHIKDVNMVMEMEDTMDDPGSEMIRIVEHAVNSLPPVEK